MFNYQSKIEAKARHVSLLKQKINLFHSQIAAPNVFSNKRIRQKKKLLTQITQAQSQYNLRSKKLVKEQNLQKVINKSSIKNSPTFTQIQFSKKQTQNKISPGQIFKRQRYFWKANQKAHINEMNLLKYRNMRQNNVSQEELQNQRNVQPINKYKQKYKGRCSNRVRLIQALCRSERIATSKLKQRIKNVHNSSSFIYSAFQKLMSQQQNLIHNTLKQMEINLTID